MSQPVARCPRGRAARAAMIATVVLTPGVARAGTTLFVDAAAAPGGHGESWILAYRSLQDALAVARESEDVTAVHVAQGVYAPDEGEVVITGDRTASFRLISGVSIRGGFAGVNAADPDARDTAKFATVLTGDLGRNDGPGFTGNGENSYHVLAVTNAADDAVLDGFVVRGGNADGPAPDERGGGILIIGGAPAFRDVVFEGNTAFFGGAMYIENDEAAFESLVFDGNRATFGGAVYADRSRLTMRDTTVRGGTALLGGGAYLAGGAPAFDDCLLTDNNADLDGGAVYAIGADPAFARCELSVNRALFDGGGLYAAAGATVLEACTFVTNFADEGGGARLVGGAPAVIDCVFSLNFARRGGAMNASGGTAQITRTLFDRNESEAGGGALAEGGAPVFELCDFVRNEAIVAGGFQGTGGTPTIDRCTFTANEGGQRGGAIVIAGGAADVRDCVFTGNTAEGFFVSNGGAVDLVEATGTTIARCVFVANRANFGAGLAAKGDATITDCEILDHPGFVGGGMYVTEGAVVVERCTFRGNSATGDVVASGGGLHGFLADPVLRDCRFEANTSTTTGGGVHVEGGSPVIVRCVFEGNTANGNGGGLFVADGGPVIIATVFRANATPAFGGGVAAENSDGTYRDCIFAGNRGAFGGGIVSLSGDPEIANCVFTGNRATGTVGQTGCTGGGLGGGVSSIGGAPRIVNCTFASNAAECGGSGGGVSVIVGSIVNCVLWNNTDAGGADESAQVSGAVVSVDYSCVQGLTGGLGGEGNIGTDPRFVDRLGPDGAPGTNDDDVRLRAGSPCIDAGDNDAVPAGVTTDAAGLPRFVDDPAAPDTGRGAPPLVDLGAFEHQASSCPADINGDGVVGMGDVLVVLTGWGACPPKGGCPGDISANGSVDFADVLAVIASWGACP